jgi:hypothetical protein
MENFVCQMTIGNNISSVTLLGQIMLVCFLIAAAPSERNINIFTM